MTGKAVHDMSELTEFAAMRIQTQLRYAIDIIDEQLGEGYAAEHPDLLGATVQACALNLLTDFLDTHIEPPIALIADTIRGWPMGE
jgi:hypothetical protein